MTFLKNKNILNLIYNLSLKYIIILTLSTFVLFGFNASVLGAYNTTAKRYEDTLTSPHQEASYFYKYENT